MVSKSDRRRKRKEKERKKRKELGRQKETLAYNFTSEHRKQGIRNTVILIGLTILAAGIIIYVVDTIN